MKKALRKHINPLLVTIIIFLSLLIIGRPLVFGNNFICYSPEEIHFYDNSLFNNNLDVISGKTNVSPRLMSMLFVKLLMQCGLSYESVYLVVFFLSITLTTAALVLFLVKIAAYNNLLFAVMLTIFVSFSSLSNIAGFPIFDPSSLFMGLGLANVLIGIVLSLFGKSLKERNLAYVFVIIGAFCHIHEGIWGFFIISIILLFRYRLEFFRVLGLYASLFVILLLALPVLFSNEVSMNSFDFYNIYVIFRHPHHLLFDVNKVRVIAAFVSYLLIYFLVNKVSTNITERDPLVILIFVFVALVLLWYISCDVLRIPFFAKLYIPKAFKYTSFVFILYLSKTIFDNIQNRYLFLLLIIVPFFNSSFLTLVSISICIIACLYNNILRSFCLVLLIAGCLVFFNFSLFNLSFLFGVSLFFIHKKIKYLPLLYFTILAVYIWMRPVLKNNDLPIDKSQLASHSGRAVFDFGRSISDYLGPNDIFLIDPANISGGYIQHISKRCAYVLYKCVPSYDSAIAAWYDRMMRVQSLNNWDADRIAKFMKKDNINYYICETNTIDSNLKETFDVLLIKDNLALLKIK